MKKRLFSTLLCLALSVSMLPTTVQAATLDESRVSYSLAENPYSKCKYSYVTCKTPHIKCDSPDIKCDIPGAKLMKLNDGKILCVFIGDGDGTDQGTIYYMVYERGRWENPVILDTDGTLDAYPELSDLDNGEILITWSSADKAVSTSSPAVLVMSSMNIKAALFSKAGTTPGTVMEVTKTTSGDTCADTRACAAYDDLSRIILYYTKTSYDTSKGIFGLSGTSSAAAYMIYDKVINRWYDADNYTDAEIAKITQAAIDSYKAKNPNCTDAEASAYASTYLSEYKANWYGQRLLDLRTSTDDAHPVLVDTTSASNYESSDGKRLALFAYTVDNDGDLDTIDDRDVYMQTCNLDESTFSPIIRITTKSGIYFSPKFSKSDYVTYLFYGEIKADSSGEAATETQTSAVNYFDVGDLLENTRYKKSQEAGSDYYVSTATYQSYQFDVNGTHPSEYLDKISSVLKRSDDDQDDTSSEAGATIPVDYSVSVTYEGKICLIWQSKVDGARQILAALYAGSSDSDDSQSDWIWSEPVVLTGTDGTQSDSYYYTGIGSIVVDNQIFIMCGRGRYENVDNSHLELVSFKYSLNDENNEKAKVTALEQISGTIQPSTKVRLRASVKNGGLKEKAASQAEPIRVYFTVNGGETVYTDITTPITGGAIADVDCELTLPSDISATSDVTVSAYIDSSCTVNKKLSCMHPNLKQVAAKVATTTTTGNIQYWYCTDCEKYFKAATAAVADEITQADTEIQRHAPTIIEGEKQTVKQSEKSTLVFRSNAAIEDFVKVILDEGMASERLLVKDVDYTVKSGSTIITLSADIVATLATGEHTLSIDSTTGTA